MKKPSPNLPVGLLTFSFPIATSPFRENSFQGWMTHEEPVTSALSAGCQKYHPIWLSRRLPAKKSCNSSRNTWTKQVKTMRRTTRATTTNGDINHTCPTSLTHLVLEEKSSNCHQNKIGSSATIKIKQRRMNSTRTFSKSLLRSIRSVWLSSPKPSAPYNSEISISLRALKSWAVQWAPALWITKGERGRGMRGSISMDDRMRSTIATCAGYSEVITVLSDILSIF